MDRRVASTTDSGAPEDGTIRACLSSHGPVLVHPRVAIPFPSQSSNHPSYALKVPYQMAPKRKRSELPKREPALKDLSAFKNSHHFICVMYDALLGELPSLAREWGGCIADRLTGLEARWENEGPGTGQPPDLDIIKIDVRNGKGVFLDYDNNLNMRVELNSTVR